MTVFKSAISALLGMVAFLIAVFVFLFRKALKALRS
ncbi:hypothetical protein UFOVP61_27 [uncultured Caudovirales phage]|uniref:Uncharacterized protein n=1 Tax=uncultured Caudovirales phage TaxID=2100421 RepID=A0A6J5KU42_9CAUD|nr:hypothetical protein UFOVP61_27 [uncultured Caudovirales phage]